jgi:hypothetical protein
MFSMNNVYEANLTQSSCLNCDTQYDEDSLYCAHCGCILGHTLTGTKKTNLLNVTSTETGVQQRVVNLEWGTSYFHPRARLSLYHIDLQRVMPVPISDVPIILGRNVDNAPDIFDLTQCDAEEYGVSRRHVKISRLRDFLQVEDLNSSNGTFLNKTRLLPDVTYTLRNRAILQLGHMVLKIHFI